MKRKLTKRNINEVYEDFHKAEAMEKRWWEKFLADPSKENFEKYKTAKLARTYNEEIINKHKQRFWEPWNEEKANGF